jgi:hypothetical protein
MTPKHKPGNFWGFRCPECGRDDAIVVAATVWARLGPDGSDIGLFENEAHEWDLRSMARCDACDFQARLVSFTPSDRGPP